MVVIVGTVVLAADCTQAEPLIAHSKVHKLASKLSSRSPGIPDTDAVKCLAYAEEKGIDVSGVSNWIILYQPRPEVDCSHTCENQFYIFAFDYKEPMSCCCGTT